ncbi:hypothetical protein DXH95_00845 [Sphingorhabdus pulchriflava]|uniref:Uncharacterized protein n=1 Tax=Sphingorhabdus pulchriflava TaxID=2292257 RepID=A0A371BF46_9SPHN|nr:hypothetical protein [Sphingorhabdus pulchriflava]RDV06033.1 hypothetical protein DXH95_00845 [Sphingorhabdus pulchriflava]
MQSKLKLDHQTQAVAMATGGAAIAAIAAMFVPTGIWETLTGSTGVSEMIPATAAPLGDTARALISFTFGALTFAVLTVMLLRKNARPKQSVITQPEIEAEAEDVAEPVWIEPSPEAELAEVDGDEAEKGSLLSRLRDRISAFAAARRSADGITDFEDLPKLRSGDAHPDAPPRRPLLATRDLVDPAEAEETLVEQLLPAVDGVEDVVPNEPVAVSEIVETEIVETENVVEAVIEDVASTETAEPVEVAAPVSSLESDNSAASLADMVTRLESALSERDAKLARLEALVANRPVSNVQPIREAKAVEVEPQSAESQPMPVASRPMLEAVDPEPAPIKGESEELDAALRSALETLHRMNARTR